MAKKLYEEADVQAVAAGPMPPRMPIVFLLI